MQAFLFMLPTARAAIVTIGAIISDADTTVSGQREKLAAQLAVDAINADSTILGGHTLALEVVDDGGSQWTAMRATCELMRGGVHAMIGPSYSSNSLAVLSVTTPLQVPLISYSATSPSLGVDSGHDYFARVVPSDAAQGPAMISVVKHHNWTQVCILFMDNTYATNGAIQTQDAAARAGIKVLSLQSYDATTKNATNALNTLAQSGCRIILNWCGGTSATDCRDVMDQARDTGLVRGGDYVWLLSDGCENAFGNEASEFAGFGSSLVGTLCLVPSTNDDDPTARTAGQLALHAAWPAGSSPQIYASFIYDAVLAAARALDAVPAAIASPFSIGSSGMCIPDTTSTATPWAHGDTVHSALGAVSFDGATAATSLPVAFTANLERQDASYSLYNLQAWPGVGPSVGTFQKIGAVRVTHGALSAPATTAVTMSAAVQWSSTDGPYAPVPSDVLPRDVCVVTAIQEPYVYFVGEEEDSECSDSCKEQQFQCPKRCYRGLAIDVLEKVARIAGFSYYIKHSPPVGYTQILIDHLQEGTCDIAVGDWTANSPRAPIVDMAYPYFGTGLKITRVRRSAGSMRSLSSYMGAVFRPFKPGVWLMIFLVYLPIFALVFAFVERDVPADHGARAEDTERKGRSSATHVDPKQERTTLASRLMLKTRRTASFAAIWTPLNWALATFMGSETTRGDAHTAPGQLLSSLFSFCNLLIMSSYTANLAASFTIQRNAVDFTGLADIGSIVPYDRVALANLGGSIQDFWDLHFPGAECYNCASNHSGESTTVNLDRLAEGEFEYAIGDAHTMMHLIINEAKWCSLETIGEIFYKQDFAFMVPKGSLLASRITEATLVLRENMQLEQLIESYFEPDGQFYRSVCGMVDGQATDAGQLGLEHVAGIFMVGVAGILGALVLYGLLKTTATASTTKIATASI